MLWWPLGEIGYCAPGEAPVIARRMIGICGSSEEAGGPSPRQFARCLCLSGTLMKGIRRFRGSPAPSPGGSGAGAPAERTAPFIDGDKAGGLPEQRIAGRTLLLYRIVILQHREGLHGCM